MQSDHLVRTLGVPILACLAFLVACDVSGRSAAEAQAPDGSGRFEISAARGEKGPGTLLRLDTATGRVWGMGVLDEGLWKPYAEGPDGVPSPGAVAPGRYSLRAFSQRRAGATLVRVDSATGRVWRTPARNDGVWVLIPQPGEEPAAPATPE